MNKFTVGAIIAILLALGGLFAWSQINSGNKVDYGKYNSRSVIEATEDNGNIGEHVRGKADSKIVVIEYADFQCEYCALMMPKMSTLHEKYGDKVAFVFRNYNLSYHQNARAASAAAEAAGLQGYFWEMTEKIYDGQSDWNYISDTSKRTNVFVQIFEEATEGKGDVNKFKSDLTNVNVMKKIDFDIGLGKRVDDIKATPTIYINGEDIEVKDGVEDAIASKLDVLLKAEEENVEQ
ncbi:thioredoxin domain-containing protein [Candidatus Saccharibacteria bacterium]|nr:thioredoxin domain-containing protein [Candidatus Saccharibacteria bacterium]